MADFEVEITLALVNLKVSQPVLFVSSGLHALLIREGSPVACALPLHGHIVQWS